MGFNKTQLSRMLGVSTHGISRPTTEYNLEGLQFCDLTDEDLDRIVVHVRRQFSQSGYRQMLAILKSQGIVVRENQLRKSLQRCDPLGSALWWFATIGNTMYVVLWHFGTWIGNTSLSSTNIFFVYPYYPVLAPAFRLAYLPIQVNVFHYMYITLCLSTGPAKH